MNKNSDFIWYIGIGNFGTNGQSYIRGETVFLLTEENVDYLESLYWNKRDFGYNPNDRKVWTYAVLTAEGLMEYKEEEQRNYFVALWRGNPNIELCKEWKISDFTIAKDMAKYLKQQSEEASEEKQKKKGKRKEKDYFLRKPKMGLLKNEILILIEDKEYYSEYPRYKCRRGQRSKIKDKIDNSYGVWVQKPYSWKDSKRKKQYMVHKRKHIDTFKIVEENLEECV